MRLPALLAAAAVLATTGALAQPVASAPSPAFTASVMGVGLNVADIDKSVAFYRDGVGMKVVGHYDLPNGRETFLGFGGMASPVVILVSGPAAAAAAASHPVNYGRIVMRANDVKLLQARLRAVRYPIGEVRDIGSGRQVLIATDPDGYHMEFVAGL